MNNSGTDVTNIQSTLEYCNSLTLSLSFAASVLNCQIISYSHAHLRKLLLLKGLYLHTHTTVYVGG